MIMLKLREKEKFWIDISFLFSHNFPNKLIAQVFRSQVQKTTSYLFLSKHGISFHQGLCYSAKIIQKVNGYLLKSNFYYLNDYFVLFLSYIRLSPQNSATSIFSDPPPRLTKNNYFLEQNNQTLSMQQIPNMIRISLFRKYRLNRINCYNINFFFIFRAV